MIQFDKLTDKEIEERTTDVVTRLHHVRTQVDEAKMKAAAFGDYSDAGWFKRAKSAQRLLGLEHQLLLKEASNRRKERNRKNGEEFERKFISVARDVLPSEVFKIILDGAMKP